MKTVVQKWGNSLGIRIPAIFAMELDLKYGNAVEITQEDGRIVIMPGRRTLDELLSKITDENLHDAVDTGASVGKEEW